MLRLSLSAFALAFISLVTAPAHAQATRTWVAGLGSDDNPCSRTSPCQTFAGAISKTAAGGEISCIDPGGWGTVTITKSITIDCRAASGGILNAGSTGVLINSASAVVTLRGFSINGANVASSVGIRINAASRVILEDLEIFGQTQQGVLDVRTAPGMLVMKRTTIRNNAGTGVAVAASGGNHAALLEGVTSVNNGYGVAAATNNAVILVRSEVAGNANAGLAADPGANINVDASVVSFNVTGVVAGGNFRLSDSTISFNSNGFVGAGAILSNGNNRIYGNTSSSVIPTAAGPASSEFGLQ